MALTQTEKDVLLGFVDELMDRFGNDGCNDMSLPRNRENRELIRAVDEYEGLPEEERYVQPRTGPLVTSNITVLEYIKHRLEEELSGTTPSGG